MSMDGFIKNIKEKGLSRRTFVQSSALAAAALMLHGCASGKSNNLQPTDDTEPIVEGEWIPVICNNHCMGMCSLKAYMVDGIPIRLKTDDTHEDSPEWPQRRACQLGRSRIYDNFGPLRLKFPMKRKSWQPGGGANAQGELRGRDEWERISWEEALDYIADEMKRIRDTYGNRAILGIQPKKATKWSENSKLSPDYTNRYGWSFMNVLNLFGGFTATWGPWSSGSWTFSDTLYGGSSSWCNDRMDCRNIEYAIVFGNNAIVSTDGGSIHVLTRPMKDAGVKFYYIDPMYTDGIAAIDAEWVPIRPATDKALLIGMAYVMFSEDDPATNPIIDWEFLEKYTIGYDADHMPEDVDPSENFRDYVLGTYDGVAKDPAWAEKICGVPADKILELGRVMAKDNKTAIIGGVAPARTNDSEIYTQLIFTVGSMGGHIGKSGHMTSGSMPGNLFNGGSIIREGGWPLAEIYNPVDDCVDHTGMWKALLEKKYHWTGNQEYLPFEEREIDIKCIYSFVMNTMHSTVNMATAVDFFRSVDLVVSQSITLHDSSRYADFVLPMLTPWEIAPMIRARNDYVTLGQKIVEPIYEARSYQWVGAELLKRWGLDPEEAFPIDEHMQNFAMIFGATIKTEDGKDWEPLISFTEEEAARFGPDATPRAEGRISYTELSEIGIYTIKRAMGDQYTTLGGASFINDPEENPVGSESGKLEIYSKKAVRLSSQMGYTQIPPIPSYYPTTNGYEYTFSDYENGVKGDTPYQFYSPHYPRCKHSHFDNVQVLREAFIRPVWVSSKDAREKGISDGDTVRVFNEYGSLLRPAYVTERIMPGVLGLPHGAQCLVDESTGFNIAGSDNWLSYPSATGLSAAGYNSQRCDFEKWSEPLPADVDIPNPTPDFQRV
jgi:anaerobic dimethyl sulfoxide reductase subunit A